MINHLWYFLLTCNFYFFYYLVYYFSFSFIWYIVWNSLFQLNELRLLELVLFELLQTFFFIFCCLYTFCILIFLSNSGSENDGVLNLMCRQIIINFYYYIIIFLIKLQKSVWSNFCTSSLFLNLKISIYFVH